ncbi:HPr-rel-A system PqqD family peptide chaperone [Roseateles sp.]|uniref:HPr-rel-A system PqqD family peptide chaperone n=1 Tax=Roseateles sp. TaxID=1971397 RepID=UPI003BACA6CD
MQESLWMIGRPADITWRDWDGLGAVYDDGSGDTHLVDVLAIEILDLLARQPRSVVQLVEQLADAIPDLMDRETAFALLERHVRSLKDFGLVDQVLAPA